jgi:hypothetical protein
MKSKQKAFVPLKLWRETRFSCDIRQRRLRVNPSAARLILFISPGVIASPSRASRSF